MGNCQAVEVAAALVEHPGGGKVERFYSPVSAHEVMTSNPGHYVALVAVASPSPGSDSGGTVAVRQQLKLLRPDDSLVLGHVYCLISFEDVLKEFVAKNRAKLGKMVKQSGGLGGGYDHTKKNKKNKDSGCSDPNSPNAKALNFSPVQEIAAAEPA
ncbi:uncharacterized protein LOC116201254 isoform X2 [Punica granatum]|uniref:Uncharacterized protein LOC116201254 isoform X2 n=1 Tax=Punica granatum TaxID=22663 RepID=A0A6P8D1I8_PUNGR|nr:uncharacterized protein LOC116201254 isoform X2 [Punica granatum]